MKKKYLFLIYVFIILIFLISFTFSWSWRPSTIGSEISKLSLYYDTNGDDPPPPTNSRPPFGSKTEFNDQNYQDVDLNDNTYFDITVSADREAYVQGEINIDNISGEQYTINNITWTWNVRMGNSKLTAYFYVWNFTSSSWYECATNTSSTSEVSRNCVVDVDNFVNSTDNNAYSLLYTTNTDASIGHNINIDYIIVNSNEDEITTTLTNPSDNFFNNSNDIQLGCSVTDTEGDLNSIKLYGNWSGGWHLNETSSISGSSNSTNFSMTNINDGTYIWNCQSNVTTDSRVDWGDSNYTFSLDTTDPITNFYSPNNNTYSSSLNPTFISNQTDNIKLKNATINIYNSTSGLSINITNNSVEITNQSLPSAGTTSGKFGVKFVVNKPTSLENITKHSGSGATIAQILNSSGSVISSTDYVGDTATFSSPITLDKDTTYYAVSYDNGDTYTFKHNEPDQIYPISRNYVNFTAGYQDGTEKSNSIYDIISIGVSFQSTINISGTSNSTSWDVPLPSEGNYLWNVETCDEAGNCAFNSTNYTITIDTTNTSVSYNPTTDADSSYINRDWVLVNISASDDNLDSVRLSWEGTNETFASNSGSNYWENKTGLSDGSYSFYGWANDSAGNLNVTSTRSVTVDTINPSISIIYPENTTYGSVTQLNFSASDTNLDDCWYSTDGGATNSSANDCSSNFTGLSSVDGSNTWIVYANDSAGNENSSTITFTSDLTPPTLSIIYPTNTTYTSSQSQLNFSASDDSGLSACWYSTDGGAINSSTNDCSSNFTSVSSSEGSNTWTLYSNDSVGNENSTSITFTIDTTPPSITINQPLNQSYSSTNMTFNITVIDVTSSVSACNYSLDNVENISMENFASNQWNASNSSMVEGLHTARFYCNDSQNNLNDTESVVFTIDTSSPSLTILYPENTTYNINVNQFNYSVSDTYSSLSGCWYSIDNGITNSSIDVSCSNFTSVSSSEGSNTWTVYVNDSAGNENNSLITFTRDITPPNIISPANSTLEFLTNNLNVDFDANDNVVGVDTFYINWSTNFSINSSSGVLTNTTSLGTGNWVINVSVNDTQNNTNSTTYLVNVSDTIDPIVTLVSPESGTKDFDGILDFVYNVSDLNDIDSCSLYLSNLLDQTDNTITKNTNQTFQKINPDTSNSLIWFVSCTDDSNNQDNSSARNVDTLDDENVGGGGGGSPVIVGTNETQWTISTGTGGDKYEIFKIKDTSRDLDILFENLGTSDRTIKLFCVNVIGDLCDYVRFDDEEFILNVSKGIKERKVVTINFPSELEDVNERFNIVGIDEFGQQGVLTIEAKKTGFFSGLFTKFISSTNLLGLKIPYILLFIITWIATGILSNFTITKKKAPISVIIGLASGFLLLVII